jgi:hypothetical protein
MYCRKANSRTQINFCGLFLNSLLASRIYCLTSIPIVSESAAYSASTAPPQHQPLLSIDHFFTVSVGNYIAQVYFSTIHTLQGLLLVTFQYSWLTPAAISGDSFLAAWSRHGYDMGI